jgi:hypothetical protein
VSDHLTGSAAAQPCKRYRDKSPNGCLHRCREIAKPRISAQRIPDMPKGS